MAEHMADLAFANAPPAILAPTNVTLTPPSAVAALVSPIAAAVPKTTPVQYHCSYCRFACTWKYDLELHLKQKHGVHKKLWGKAANNEKTF